MTSLPPNRTRASGPAIGHRLAVTLLLLALVAVAPTGARAQSESTEFTVNGVFMPPRSPGMVGWDNGRPDFEERIDGTPRTWKDMRDAGVVRQGHDYSCGSAALATLLAGADPDVTERQILLEVLEGQSDEEKRATMEQGLSLLDLKGAANRRNLRAEGYRVEAEFLTKLSRPVIVFVQPDGYRHFAVLKGVSGDRVFLADPARGNVRMPAYRFLEMWQGEDGKGVIFVVGAESSPLLALGDDADTRPERMAVRQLLLTGPMNVALRPSH